jgi:hypothetical protein
MPKREITNTDRAALAAADVIDVRYVIARFEELEAARDEVLNEGAITGLPRDTALADWHCEHGEELNCLFKLLEELKASGGGDEQWRGDWYPLTLIRDSYFKDYAQELAEDCCPFQRNSPEAEALQMWPYSCIDWEQAASELRMDYTSVAFDGVTYWVR